VAFCTELSSEVSNSVVSDALDFPFPSLLLPCAFLVLVSSLPPEEEKHSALLLFGAEELSSELSISVSGTALGFVFSATAIVLRAIAVDLPLDDDDDDDDVSMWFCSLKEEEEEEGSLLFPPRVETYVGFGLLLLADTFSKFTSPGLVGRREL
jgi:hypothetical protein